MKPKNALCGLAIAVILQMGLLAGSAQTNIYLFSGSETNITLPPGTYIITAYGAPGGGDTNYGGGGLGAKMSGQFNFSTSTTLTLLVGGGASSLDTNGNYYEYGGGGGSFVVNGSTPMVIAGGGGGGYEYGSPGSVSTNGNRGNLPGPGAGGAGGGGGAELSYTYSSGGGGGGGGFLGNGGDGGNGFSFGYSITNGGGGGFSFENGGGGGIASSYYGIANYYHGGNGGYGGGGSGGGYSGVPDMGYFPEPGGGGGGGGYEGGHGGYAPDGGNGGGSIIDPSAIAILTEVSGIPSPDDSANGEIIFITVPTPLVVTNTADSGPGTLRSAITNAANGAVITFDPSLSGATITLAITLAINTNLTIDASALPGGLQINGNGSVQIFNVTSNITVFLNSFTITNGYTTNYGGGIYNGGTLTLTNCILLGNNAPSGDGYDGLGGGIYNAGTLTMNQCTLSGNENSIRRRYLQRWPADAQSMHPVRKHRRRHFQRWHIRWHADAESMHPVRKHRQRH